MKKVGIAILASFAMGFIGLVLGIFCDEVFGANMFPFAPYLSTIFVIVTMGAFILHSLENKK